MMTEKEFIDNFAEFLISSGEIKTESIEAVMPAIHQAAYKLYLRMPENVKQKLDKEGQNKILSLALRIVNLELMITAIDDSLDEIEKRIERHNNN